ncbi:class I SAM-dependent methyltransferase [candidate division KSB1 bacterium]|nr:class I SAM-dependent methyltransferase [candidate division KSB1 bacterium]
MSRIQAPRIIGSAAVQGELWGARARDWAEVQGGLCRPLFEAVLYKTGIQPGISHLDIGCGSGMACQLSARKGARVCGIDAASALIAIAKERTPQGDFRVGEMEELPYEDNRFDVVTDFNSVQYAANPVNALNEARRVARAQALVAIATWGNPKDCEAAAYLNALRALSPPEATNLLALSENGKLEAMAAEAGLNPVKLEDVDCLWSYPDLEHALAGLLSDGTAVEAIRTAGEERVRKAVINALSPFKTASGGYWLENKFRCLIATV